MLPGRISVLPAVAALSLLAACQSSPPQAADGKCIMEQAANLPMAEVDRQFLIPVTIDGHATQFQIDTGSWSPLSLFKRAADEFGLRRTAKERMSYGFGGESSYTQSEVAELDLGGQAKWQNLTIPTFEIAGQSRPGAPAGLLGYGFLKDFDLEFDAGENSFKAFTHNRCNGRVVYWAPPFYLTADFHLAADDNLISIPVKVDGIPLTAIFDSGATSTTMTWASARRLGITLDTPGVRQAGMGGGIGKRLVEAWVYSLPTLEIGGETLKNVPILIVNPAPVREGGGYHQLEDRELGDMWIGADFFEKNRIYIAYDERKIYFSPYKYKISETAPPPLPAPR